MYTRILVALDGTQWSNMAMNAAIELAEFTDTPTLIGCHVYGARMHRKRFEQMEPGLPERYQEEQELTRLRGAHEDLITDGMQIISDAYLAPMNQLATQRKITFEGATPEGRNYLEILKVVKERQADLVVLGAHGHGYVPESILGSTAERILSHCLHSDVLLMKQAWKVKRHPILVGVDGSQNSYAALLRAASIARVTGSKVKAVAVYDPYLHSGVFTHIAGVLPPEKQEKFNFTAQEQLHDEIIDDGLEQLYSHNLDQGVQLLKDTGIEIEAEVLNGKVFPQIHHHASYIGAGLVVMGRWGLHKEAPSLVGSNSLNLARICTTNLLIVAPPTEEIKLPSMETLPEIEWSDGALQILDKIPPFARSMAKTSIENRARNLGVTLIDESLVRAISEKMGMRSGGDSND
ncbi:MAG: universal stress protein [Candidatus Thorarchaeota archaeon]